MDCKIKNLNSFVWLYPQNTVKHNIYITKYNVTLILCNTYPHYSMLKSNFRENKINPIQTTYNYFISLAI